MPPPAGAFWLAADVHLAENSPERNARFFAFLQNAAGAGGARAVFLLGDLFDLWTGDGDAPPAAAEAQRALKQTAAAGVAVFVQRGNRDFLLGARFANASGCNLLPDAYALQCGGCRWLLMHGDQLADDPPYLLYRRFGWPLLRAAAAVLPAKQRRQTAELLRAKTRRAAGAGAPKISRRRAAAALQQHGCAALLHGHLHRQESETWEENGEKRRRFCLPAWENAPGYAAIWEDNLEFFAC